MTRVMRSRENEVSRAIVLNVVFGKWMFIIVSSIHLAITKRLEKFLREHCHCLCACRTNLTCTIFVWPAKTKTKQRIQKKVFCLVLECFFQILTQIVVYPDIVCASQPVPSTYNDNDGSVERKLIEMHNRPQGRFLYASFCVHSVWTYTQISFSMLF